MVVVLPPKSVQEWGKLSVLRTTLLLRTLYLVA